MDENYYDQMAADLRIAARELDAVAQNDVCVCIPRTTIERAARLMREAAEAVGRLADLMN